jgi:hypothetical protein
VQRSALGYVRAADMDISGESGQLLPIAPRTQTAGQHLKSACLEGFAAGTVAGLLSGLPSTVHALATGRDPLAAARAAGNLLLPAEAGSRALLFAGGIAHVALSLGWGTVLAVTVRRTSLPSVAVGLAGGAAIAALDLGLLAHGPIGRRWPLIRALPVGPQVADHLAFGAVAGAFLGGSRRRCRGDTPQHPPGLHGRG